MSKNTTLAIALAATLAFPLSAFAQGAGGGGGAGAGGAGSGDAGASSGAGGAASSGSTGSQADTAPGAPGVKGDQMGATPPGDATRKQTTGFSRGNTQEKMGR